MVVIEKPNCVHIKKKKIALNESIAILVVAQHGLADKSKELILIYQNY